MSPTSLDQLRQALQEHATDADQLATLSPVQRAHDATRRAAAGRTRRVRALAGVGVAAATAVAAVVVLAPLRGGGDPAPPPAATTTTRPAPEPTASPRVHVAGVAYPGRVTVAGVEYGLTSTYLPDRGTRVGHLEIDGGGGAQVVAWSTPPGTRGLVIVTIDGVRVSRRPAGVVRRGPVLAAHQPHTVVVRAPGLRGAEQLGIAMYDKVS
jgi:hypothetical protein